MSSTTTRGRRIFRSAWYYVAVRYAHELREYNVSFEDDERGVATYYTTDRQDALDTADAMEASAAREETQIAAACESMLASLEPVHYERVWVTLECIDCHNDIAYCQAVDMWDITNCKCIGNDACG